MSERDAFLRAIRAHPDDDTARLVFADWLDEHNDPLGTFVRVQLELHPIRNRSDHPRFRELLKQEAALLRKHRAKWLGKAARVGKGVPETNVVFERGLPDRACVSLDTLLAEGGKLLDACPTLREVAVFDVQNRGAELADCPLLDRIHRLEIADWPTQADAAALFASDAIRARPVLRVWTGTDVAGCCLNWVSKGAAPGGRVELVQLPPGIDADVKKFATRFRRTHGRELHILRPFDRAFTIRPYYRIDIGRLPDGRQGFLREYNEAATLVVFDSGGNTVGVRQWVRPDREPEGWPQSRAKLDPGPIQVKAFWADDDFGVSPWSPLLSRYIESPFERDAGLDTEADWRGRGGLIRQWIESGDCYVTTGDISWVNRGPDGREED